jgi:cytochrome c5
MKKNIWFPLILIIALWVLGISGAYFITVDNQSSKASAIILEPNFLFYSDPAATHSIDNIKLPELTPGNVYTFTFYVKNTSSVSQNISAGNIFVPTSIGTLTMTFDGQVQKTLEANAIAKADGILTVTGADTENPIDFVVSINASPVTNTTTTLPQGTTTTAATTLPQGTTTTATTATTSPSLTTTPTNITTTTTTPVILDGQAIFSANCTSCHRSLPATNLTQAQLSTFISRHNTGRNLTAAQAASIAAFLKP